MAKKALIPSNKEIPQSLNSLKGGTVSTLPALLRLQLIKEHLQPLTLRLGQNLEREKRNVTGRQGSALPGG